MTRVATMPKPPAMAPTSLAVEVPREKVAMRAYEKWCHRGCIHGDDQQDWYDAERELHAELQKLAKTPGRR